MENKENTAPLIAPGTIVPDKVKKVKSSEQVVVPLNRYRGIVTASRILDHHCGGQDGSTAVAASAQEPKKEDELLDRFMKKPKRITRDEKIRPKYELEIAYSGKKGDTKIRKLLCGVHGSIDRGTCTLAYTEQQATANSRMMATRVDFDRELFEKAGGVLNPNFWAFNLDWCDETDAVTFQQRLYAIDDALRRLAQSK